MNLEDKLFIVWDEDEQNFISDEGKTERASQAERMNFWEAEKYTKSNDKAYTMFEW